MTTSLSSSVQKNHGWTNEHIEPKSKCSVVLKIDEEKKEKYRIMERKRSIGFRRIFTVAINRIG